MKQMFGSPKTRELEEYKATIEWRRGTPEVGKMSILCVCKQELRYRSRYPYLFHQILCRLLGNLGCPPCISRTHCPGKQLGRYTDIQFGLVKSSISPVVKRNSDYSVVPNLCWQKSAACAPAGSQTLMQNKLPPRKLPKPISKT